MRFKRIAALLLAVTLLLGATGAAAAGTGSDPLISLSYITNTYIPSFMDRVADAVAAAFSKGGSSGAVSAVPGRFTAHDLGRDSTVTLSTGGSVMVYEGDAAVSFSSGTVIDVTAGKEVPSGTVLTRGSRYMAAEDTRATVTLTTAGRAVVDGAAAVTKSSGKVCHFIDVPGHEWFHDYVVAAVDRGLINGKTPNTYDPAGNLTLAEAVKLAAVMHQLYHSGAVTLYPGSGSDWYKPFVEYAVAQQIVGAEFLGYDLNTMNKAVTRQQYVGIFYKALPESRYAAINTVADGAIPDVAMGDANAREIYTFYRAGILGGSDDRGSFLPNSSIVRREVAAILSRMFDDHLRVDITLPKA